MASKPLKIFFISSDGIGHQNACVGMAQALAKRGHDIIFITNETFSGPYKKLGFKEIVMKSNARNQMHDNKSENETKEEKEEAHPLAKMSGMLKGLKEEFLNEKSSYEKLQVFDPNKKDFFYFMAEEIKELEPEFKKLIEEEKPDLIIVDNFLVAPCIMYGKTPWALLWSGGPIHLFNTTELPPPSSGYPVDDRTDWEKFRAKLKETFQAAFYHFQNSINKSLGYPGVDENHFLPKSPFFNIYGYPKELDYHDVISIPDTYISVDAFCRESSEPFELPEEFKAKIKPGDKLIYLSMGSMASIDVDLMRRLVDELSRSPHKFIVSKGPFHDQYELPDNMWGAAFVPQVKILPLVDMIITHGGNNTVTESMTFGKPMLVMPLFGDQYDNAQRIKEKGYGTRLDAYGFQNGELVKLVDKIVNDDEIRQRCQETAERMKSSNSKEEACIKIEKFIEQHKSSEKSEAEN